MTISALPTPPSRSDPANFPERAEAFLAALANFVAEANALAVQYNTGAMPYSITTNSTAPALSITQTGAGHALFVEDLSGDSTPFVIDASGRVNVGSTTWYNTPALSAIVPAKVQINGFGSDASLALNSWQSGTNVEANLLFNRGDSSVIGDFSDASDIGDSLGSLKWSGSDGVGFSHGATIRAVVDGVVVSGSMPTRLEFLTTEIGGAAPVESMRVDSAQRVIFQAGIATKPTRSTAASGSTITLTNAVSHLLYDLSSTAAALTITLPSASLSDGQSITIATRSAITSLTVNGGTIYGAPTTLAAGGFASFIYSSAGAAWFRKG